MVVTNILNAYIDTYAQTLADKTFIIDADNDIAVSYQQLHQDIWSLKHYFDKANITRGDCVGFMLDNSYHSVVLFLAAIYHGFTILPINILSGSATTQYIIQHSEVKLMFASKQYSKQFYDILANVDTVYHYDIDQVFERYHNQDNQDTTGNTSSSTAVLIYTSGTTGKPKGVVLTHKNIIAGANNTVIAHHIVPSDRALCVLPLFHVNAEIVTIIAPLISGSSVVITKKFSSSRFWQIITRYQCTWFSVVPTIVSYLLSDESENFNTADTSNIRFGRSASAPLPQEVHKNFERRFKITIIETMGLSETAAQILSNPLDKQKYGSAGIAYGNMVKVLDSNHNEVTNNSQGELAIKGDNVMPYYHNNEEATTNVFTSNGYLLTGDLGYKDDDGFFFITGRKKELIIKGGENISPREIDEVLYKHDDILEACAFAVPDTHYGEDIAVCIYTKKHSKLTKSEIIDFCRQSLGEFKSPHYVIIAKEPLLKGPSGKIQRLKIAQHINNTKYEK